VSPRKEAQLTLEQYKEIYDRLIAIFKERPRDDWKKLIVFSKQWGQHQQGVFDRWARVWEFLSFDFHDRVPGSHHLL
jgi:hypothetical protein